VNGKKASHLVDTALAAYFKRGSVLTGEPEKPELLTLTRIFMAPVTGERFTAGDLNRAERAIFEAGWRAAVAASPGETRE
jgi:hypothetical protein